MQLENRKVVVVSCPPYGENVGLPTKRGFLNKGSSFTTPRAFTLIELLVVVLIIGILAAVAVPQYQKAVWRNRYVQAKTMATALANAQEVYYLANGAYTADMYALDVELTGISGTGCNTEEKRETSDTCAYYTSWGSCNLQRKEKAVACSVYRDGKKFISHLIYLQHSWLKNAYCFADNNYKGSTVTADDLNYQICAMETGKSTPVDIWVSNKAFLY